MKHESPSRRDILRAGAGMAAVGLWAGAAPQVWAGAKPAPAARRVMPPRPARPLVIGHRGACAHRPEHTLASYAKAIADGADFVEPDLVATKDGELVARHENNIAETTDVAAHPEFAGRKTTKQVDGQAVTGWFTEDFTLAELKTLRARERLGALRPESQSYDGQFQIVTLEEICDFVGAEAAARGRTVGLIPEIKHSTYFADLGLPLEGRFIERVQASHFLQTQPVIVQSFEVGNLKLLRQKLGGYANIQLMQLTGMGPEVPPDLAKAGLHTTFDQLTTPEGLVDMASYADWISPFNRRLIPVGADGKLGAPSRLIADAHKAGLLVCTWTFRPENHFLPPSLRDGAGEGARNPAGSVAEIREYLAAGIDSFFTDDPAIGRQAVDKA